MDVMKTDLLVIGSGAAGLTASVYAATSGVRVLVVDKGVNARSGSTVGAVQLAAAGSWFNEDDSREAYFQDIIRSGCGLSNERLARVLVEEIEFILQDFVNWGLKIEMDEKGRPLLFEASGHQFSRSISAKKGKSGLGLLQTLARQANQYPNIQRWSDVIVVKILKDQERAIGAVAYDFQKARFLVIHCKAIIIASGGIGQLYPMTSNPVQSTGDGFSLALQAGVSLMDMEQIQFYPVNVLSPQSLKGLCISFYHKSKLYNGNDERFMARYEPKKMENVTRDQIAIAIAKEIHSGRGTVAGGVWLDAKDIISYVQDVFPEEYGLCLQKGVDLREDRLEVAPAAHFIMGGVKIDEHGRTNVAGVYAVGEAAGGLHGGNRLANNALTECIVFGARVGQAASRECIEQELKDIDFAGAIEPSTMFPKHGGPSPDCRPYQLKVKIREVMGRFVGVLRTREDLIKAEHELDHMTGMLDHVKIVGEHRPFSRDVLDYLEVQHMMLTAKAIVGSAKTRTESVGAHHRQDTVEGKNKPEHTIVEFHQGQLHFRKESSGYHVECENRA